MIKACSFLPAATQMIYDMGLSEMLYGVTFECPAISLVEKQKVVRCVLEDNKLSSKEIDVIFSASKANGESLYYVDIEILKDIAPDIIFTQDTCEVCQIDTVCTAAAVSKLIKQPLLISLSPNNLNDVFDCAITIAKAFRKEELGHIYIKNLRTRLDFITDTLRKNNAPLKRVCLLEWIEPIYNCGHWIPFQLAYAGGVDMLSNPGGDSIVTPWEKIVKYDPEIIVIAPCGFHPERAKSEMHLLSNKPEWGTLTAVKNNNVFIEDFEMFTQPSASTLVKGIELLASLFHPELFN